MKNYRKTDGNLPIGGQLALSLSKIQAMNPVVFTSDIAGDLSRELESYAPERIFVLTDENTRKYCLPAVRNDKIGEERIMTIPAGEIHKSLRSVEMIWEILSARQARRNSLLINIGGGLVTDVGGFAASCFKRGIKCINIPTTLLAQVDASVGGKTGINFNGFKNEIGTFSAPEKVMIDVTFLKTLPRRQILSGFAEMLKHGLLCGGEHLKKLLAVDRDIISTAGFPALLKESVEVKEKVVTEDPQEKGMRKSLNFGHTVGHALESAAIEKGTEFYHGDAVAHGMIAELYLSVLKKGFDRCLYHEIRTFIQALYPAYTPSASPEKLYEWMLHDKKNEKEGVNFTLLEAPGKVSIDNYCGRREVMEALETLSERD